MTIQEIYSELVLNDARDEQIVEDVFKCYEQGRNSIILTGRTAHVENLAKRLYDKIPDVISLTGGMGTKATREAIRKLKDTPSSVPMVVVATGKFVGEGFDEPRLDTLFLAMPISWKGTLQQYAGRLHRLYEGKDDVRIYDYIDLHVSVLEKMYSKRMSGYASIGYHIKGELSEGETADIIFEKDSYLTVFSQDILNSHHEIIIVSPTISPRKAVLILEILQEALKKGVIITIVTSDVDEYLKERRDAIRNSLVTFEQSGIRIICKPNIGRRFALIDQKIVWFGSINLLGYAGNDDSMMRIKNQNIAYELMKNI